MLLWCAGILLAPAARAQSSSSAASVSLAAGVPPALAAPADRVIVRLKDGKDLTALHRQLGTRGRKLLRQGGRRPKADLEVVDLPRGRRRDEVLQAFRDSGLVEYAEPDYALHALVEPNDFRFWDGSLWHLKNTGIYGGTVGADIDAPTAWNTRNSAAGVIVAVVDTGLRVTHEDLQANLWTNPGESGLDTLGRDKATNGIDDDGDGYVDDVHGINALDHSVNLTDDYGHGTHVAGILGATANNGVGVAGVAWQVKMMPLKYLDGTGNGTISGAIECLDYAREHGAKIVNASWGSTDFNSQALHDAIGELRSAGIILVAACGNNNGDNDAAPLYPASYPDNNIIAVAATDRTDHKAAFSNWGATTVDLAAPGASIFSTWSGSDSDYRYNDGTSMAAPQVAGAAALLWAQQPSLTYAQVIALILNNTDPIPDFAGKTVTGGRLNLAKAIAAAGGPPQAPDNLLFWENLNTGDRTVWHLSGVAYDSQSYVTNVSPPWHIAATGDFNGDGQADLVWENPATGDRAFWLMHGAAVIQSVYLANIDPAWRIVATGDFNGDGKTDLVWENTTTGDRAAWYMNGTTYSGNSGYIANIPPAWHIVGAADFNHDGKPDLVWENLTSGDRTCWLMNGVALVSGEYLASIPAAWHIAGARDFDGDGNPDLVWENTSTGDRTFWLMNGVTLESGVYLAQIDPAWRMRP